MRDVRSTRRPFLVACIVFLASVVAACASTGATLNSGVGDSFPVHPPYYAGVPRAAVASDTSRVAYFTVAFQPGASHSATFDPRPGPGTPTAALLAEMSAFLDTLVGAGAAAVRLARLGGDATSGALVAPDVRFGCITVNGTSDDECETRGTGGALGRGKPPMQLAVGRPSPAWSARLQHSLDSVRATRALVITLEVGQMLLRQTGLRGNKELELGTGYTARMPWLTSLETPVAVLQLTGALVDPQGKAIRIGAEAFQAKRTPFLVSSMGAQALLLDEDVAEARTRRRDDLPGKPLAWQVALRNLVEQLTGRTAPGR